MEQAGRKIHRVRLTPEGHRDLRCIVDGGKGSVQCRRRAHILLLADGGIALDMPFRFHICPSGQASHVVPAGLQACSGP